MALFDKILKTIFYNSCLKYRRIALKYSPQTFRNYLENTISGNRKLYANFAITVNNKQTNLAAGL